MQHIYTGVFVLELVALYFLSRHFFKKFSITIFKIFKSKAVVMYIMALLFLPGTIIHEFAHWLLATLLFVPTGKLTLWPTMEDHGIKMGSLEIAKTDFVRRTLIGLAPVFIGLLVILLSLAIIEKNNLFNNLYVVVIESILIFQVSNSMFSSKKDLEGSWIFFVFLSAIAIGLYYLNIRIDINLEPILLPAVQFLLIPILIDLPLVLLLKII